MATQSQDIDTSKQSQKPGSGSTKDPETPREPLQRGSQDFVRDTSDVDKEANRPEGADWQQSTREPRRREK